MSQAEIPPTDPGVSAHTIPRQNPGGQLPGRRGRRGRRGEHATIDLQGARQGIVTDAVPETHDGSAVYSTGPGGVDAYHYHRGQAYEQLYATREDMQIQQPERAPELKGPGQ